MVLDGLPEAEESLALSDTDSLFVDDEAPRGSKHPRGSADSEEPPSKRAKDDDQDAENPDEKKKMAMETTYDGFSIYGRVLCLVVKRKDKKGKATAGLSGNRVTMENWITSTQMPEEIENS